MFLNGSGCRFRDSFTLSRNLQTFATVFPEIVVKSESGAKGVGGT